MSNAITSEAESRNETPRSTKKGAVQTASRKGAKTSRLNDVAGGKGGAKRGRKPKVAADQPTSTDPKLKAKTVGAKVEKKEASPPKKRSPKYMKMVMAAIGELGQHRRHFSNAAIRTHVFKQAELPTGQRGHKQALELIRNVIEELLEEEQLKLVKVPEKKTGAQWFRAGKAFKMPTKAASTLRTSDAAAVAAADDNNMKTPSPPKRAATTPSKANDNKNKAPPAKKAKLAATAKPAKAKATVAAAATVAKPKTTTTKGNGGAAAAAKKSPAKKANGNKKEPAAVGRSKKAKK